MHARGIASNVLDSLLSLAALLVRVIVSWRTTHDSARVQYLWLLVVLAMLGRAACLASTMKVRPGGCWWITHDTMISCLRACLMDTHPCPNTQTLNGLATQQLVLPGQSLPDTPSALPLWAVSAAFQSSARVFLHNVTLVLPQSDYLALLQPAQLLAGGFQGCASLTATGSAAVIVTPAKSDNPVAGLKRPPHMRGVSDFRLPKGGCMLNRSGSVARCGLCWDVLLASMR